MMAKASNVTRLPVARSPADPVFFEREDVSIGTRIKYCGALGHGDWVVDDITTLLRDRSGVPRVEHVETVRVLADVVHMRNVGNGIDRRRATFSYLRYSAIWRINV